MSGYYRQMQRQGRNDARRALDERLAREDMGDAAYERMTAQADDGAFRIFGIVFIVAFALVIVGLAWFGA